MSTLSDLTDAVALMKADSIIYNAILHGPSTGDDSIVETDGGNVKTLARIIAEAEDAIADVITGGAPAILTLLGIPTYANLTAANAAIAIGKLYYDTALSQLNITTA